MHAVYADPTQSLVFKSMPQVFQAKEVFTFVLPGCEWGTSGVPKARNVRTYTCWYSTEPGPPEHHQL